MLYNVKKVMQESAECEVHVTRGVRECEKSLLFHAVALYCILFQCARGQRDAMMKQPVSIDAHTTQRH